MALRSPSTTFAQTKIQHFQQMVKHIVMFRLKKGPEAVRREAMEQFKTGIERLPEVIHYIRAIRVGFNINADESWDICLDSSFDTLEDVRSYSINPAHRAVAGALAPNVEARSCVDFEL